VEAELGSQDATQTGPHQFLIVDHQHPDHVAASRRRVASSGSVACTSQPRPPGPAWQLPPSDSARSRMLSTPTPTPVPGSATLPTVSPTASAPTGRAGPHRRS
jgi:hypothetical protein